MKFWRWLKRLFRRRRYLEVKRMPVGLERSARERGWRGQRLTRVMAEGEIKK